MTELGTFFLNRISTLVVFVLLLILSYLVTILIGATATDVGHSRHFDWLCWGFGVWVGCEGVRRD